MNKQTELVKQHRQHQEKFAYYIIALCVAALGFTIHTTLGKSLTWYQIPLAFAVSSWSLSIYNGIQYLRRLITSTGGNVKLNEIELKMSAGMDKSGGKEYAVLSKILELSSDKALKNSNRQLYLFYAGVLLFMAWHVIEMYLKSST